jgi:ribonuclease VapC
VRLFDSSALLCLAFLERGHERILELLAEDEAAVCASVNWSEVAQKSLARGNDWPLVRDLMFGLGLAVVPVEAADAEFAARLWERGGTLSIADRLCLAVGERLDATVFTADAAWGSSERIRQIR